LGGHSFVRPEQLFQDIDMFFTLPNLLTSFRAIMVPVFLILFFSHSPVLQFAATLAFVAGAITDHYDGKLARRRKEVTEFGKFADPLADKFLTMSAFVAIFIREDFGVYSPLVIIYIILIAIREFGITFIRMWGISKSTPLVTSIWGKAKTTIQLFSLIFALTYFNAREILPIWGVKLSFLNNHYFIPVVHYLFLLCMLITVISGVFYLKPSSFEVNPSEGSNA